MSDREYAIKHAHEAYRIYKDYCCNMRGLSVVTEGYRFDDDTGISVFLDYEGKVKGSGFDG